MLHFNLVKDPHIQRTVSPECCLQICFSWVEPLHLKTLASPLLKGDGNILTIITGTCWDTGGRKTSTHLSRMSYNNGSHSFQQAWSIWVHMNSWLQHLELGGRLCNLNITSGLLFLKLKFSWFIFPCMGVCVCHVERPVDKSLFHSVLLLKPSIKLAFKKKSWVKAVWTHK